MWGWLQRFFAGRPVARVVALFTALSLLTILTFTLLVPSRPIELPTVLPIHNLKETLLRVGVSLALYLLVLWAIRPGRRKPWEFGVMVLTGVWVVYFLTQHYLPFLALGLIPIVARYFMPLWSVLVIVLGLVGLSGWWGLREPLQVTFEVILDQGPRGGSTWSTVQVPVDYPNLATSFFVFLGFLFAGYSLFTLEMLVRETKAREELEATRRELEQTSRQAGVLEERQRLAREIHDTLAQSFASIVVQLEAADAAAQAEASQGRYLDQARAVARDGLSEARRMVWALRPEILEGTSLPDALRRFLQRWQEENNVQVLLTITGDPQPLYPDIEVTLLRVTQEAFSNIRKHSKARQASLTLSYMEDMILMDIQDDGVGLQPALAGSFGLRSMRERVQAFGGQITLESEPGQGTTLAISLPIYPNLSPTEVIGA